MDSKYDSYSESSGGNGYDNIELRFTPYAAVNLTVDRVFGLESQFGQSLGVNFSDVELEDGALYVDPEKDVYKLFSWKDVAGLSVSESLERGNEPTADDAPEVETKTYVGNEKTYELVAARVPEVTGPDGDTVLEATSKKRDVTVYDDETIETGDWADLGGDLVEVGDTITWYNGSEEYGPSASAKSIAETLTEYGSNAVVDEDDLYNWLPDTSGENIMRSDLEDRRLRFFTVTRESENGFTYHNPIFEDIQTDEQVTPNNRETESDAMQEAREADSGGTYPEPVADFVSSGKGLNLTRERAENLLDELLEDEDNSLTEGMLEESGGRETIVQEVL